MTHVPVTCAVLQTATETDSLMRASLKLSSLKRYLVFVRLRTPGSLRSQTFCLSLKAGEGVQRWKRRGRHVWDGGRETEDERARDEWGEVVWCSSQMTAVKHRGWLWSVYAQVDTNQDRLVSLEEFMAATKKDDFSQKDEWEVRPVNTWFQS